MIEYCGNDDIRIDQADVLIKSSGRCEESRPVHDIYLSNHCCFCRLSHRRGSCDLDEGWQTGKPVPNRKMR